MFTDASVVGCSWDALAARLDHGILAGWAAAEPELAGLGCVAELLSAWDDPVRTHQVGDALVRMAAADGGADDDALLAVMHLASPVVWRLVTALGDLDPDVPAIVVAELCCQVRGYRWRIRKGGLLTNLELDTRAAVLADVGPSSRRHPEQLERLAAEGDARLVRETAEADRWQHADLVEMLVWARNAGVSRPDIRILLACHEARGRRGEAAAAAALGISVRTLYRRRAAAVARLRDAVSDFRSTAA